MLVNTQTERPIETIWCLLICLIQTSCPCSDLQMGRFTINMLNAILLVIMMNTWRCMCFLSTKL